MSESAHAGLPTPVRSWIGRSRRIAVCIFIISVGLLVASARGLGGPAPMLLNPEASRLEVALVTAFILYFLLRMKNALDRTWLGLAFAGGLIILCEAFVPGAGGPLIAIAGVCSLLIWVAATGVSVWFVWSAFARGGASNANPGG